MFRPLSISGLRELPSQNVLLLQKRHQSDRDFLERFQQLQTTIVHRNEIDELLSARGQDELVVYLYLSANR